MLDGDSAVGNFVPGMAPDKIITVISIMNTLLTIIGDLLGGMPAASTASSLECGSTGGSTTADDPSALRTLRFCTSSASAPFLPVLFFLDVEVVVVVLLLLAGCAGGGEQLSSAVDCAVSTAVLLRVVGIGGR